MHSPMQKQTWLGMHNGQNVVLLAVDFTVVLPCKCKIIAEVLVVRWKL